MLDVFPIFAANDSGHIAPVYSKFFSNVGLFHFPFQGFNLFRLVRRYFGPIVPISIRHFSAALSITVRNIFFLCCCKQMVRIDASRVVATMADVKRSIKIWVSQPIRKAMSRLHFTINIKTAVSKNIFTTNPLPASVKRNFFHIPPKALFCRSFFINTHYASVAYTLEVGHQN